MKLPQISLRELVLLVALVALGCGWWVDHWQSRVHEAELRRSMEMRVLFKSERELAEVAAAKFIKDMESEYFADWGHPDKIHEGPRDTVLVEYQTPEPELRRSGPRAISVRRDDWSASLVNRD